MRCKKCEGLVVTEDEDDLQAGLRSMILRCVNCGQRRTVPGSTRPMSGSLLIRSERQNACDRRG